MGGRHDCRQRLDCAGAGDLRYLGPFRVFLGAYLFGGMTMLQMNLQSIGISVPTQFISMAPYAATIIVLALISRNPTWIRLNMPASLGKPFNPH